MYFRLELKLRNLSDTSAVFFKVKTTKPHRYSVKPFKEAIQIGGSQTVEIVLLPFHYKEGAVYNDKFLIEVSDKWKQ